MGSDKTSTAIFGAVLHRPKLIACNIVNLCCLVKSIQHATSVDYISKPFLFLVAKELSNYEIVTQVAFIVCDIYGFVVNSNCHQLVIIY